jgi:hypothetical protein
MDTFLFPFLFIGTYLNGSRQKDGGLGCIFEKNI